MHNEHSKRTNRSFGCRLDVESIAGSKGSFKRSDQKNARLVVLKKYSRFHDTSSQAISPNAGVGGRGLGSSVSRRWACGGGACGCS